MADTELQQLIIYVGTTAQIQAAIQAGTITENDLAFTTDAPDFQEKLTETQMNAVNSGITTQLVSLYNTHVADTTIHVTAQDKTNWNNKQNALSRGTGIDITNGTISVDFNDVATASQGAKADSAIQSISTGSTNGTIKVDGTDVSVKGLGSAAYTPSTDYASALQGTKADTALQPNDNISQLNNNAGYISYSATFYWGE